MTNSNPPYTPEDGLSRPWRLFGRWILAFIFIINVAFPLGGWHIAGFGTNVPTASAVGGSPNLVISQLYTDGGFGSSPAYRNDFIEIFNRGTSSVNLTSYSVQYAQNFAPGSSNNQDFTQVVTLTGSLAAGQYYLIQANGEATGTGPALPAPDNNLPVNLYYKSGRVAIISGTTALNCGGPSGGGTPCNTSQLAQFVDLVGYGTKIGTPDVEGTSFAPYPPTSASSIIRAGGGCTDSDDNASDFSVTTSVVAHNTGSTANSCGTNGNLRPSINPPANPITTVAQNAQPFTVTLSGTDDNSVYNWSAAPGTGVTSVSVLSGQTSASAVFSVSIQSGFTGTASFTATLTDNVNTPVNQQVSIQVGSGVTSIYTIQGASQTSPYAGQIVTTTGVVIGTKTVGGAGYFIQDPTGDGNVNTSDGIFVFVGSGLNTTLLSHTVQVKGQVSEYLPPTGNQADLTFTEIGGSPTITDLGVFTGTITPTVITADPAKPGLGSSAYVRKIPSTTFVSSTTGYNPAVNAIDFYESMEGMLVQVDSPIVVGPTNLYGETFVQSDNGVGGSPRNSRGTLYLTPTDVNPDRIMIGSDLSPVGRSKAPVANVGDRISRSVVGPFDYNFSNFKIDANQIITGTDLDRSNEVTQEVLPAVTNPTQLRIASYNIENFIEKPNSPTDQARRQVIAKDIALNLAGPDLMVIDEIQDDNGTPAAPPGQNPPPDGVVTSDQQLSNLVSAIYTQSQQINPSQPISYSYRYIAPQDYKDGGEPGGNIRQVFLYRTDRGLSFVDKPGAISTTNNSVLPDGSLQYSPGRIQPNDSAFNSSRKPLAGEFLFQGKRLIVIGNHLNSKGGDDPIYGKNQPPVLSSEVQRRAQATIIRDFVSQIQTANANAYIIVAGDMNDFQWSNPIKILKDGDGTITATNKILYDTVEDPRLTTDDKYSYVYDGNAQTLDHVLFSQPMSTSVVSLDMVHLNSEFSNADPRRATDHDPPTAVFNFGGVPVCTAPFTVTQSTDNGLGGCGSLSYAIQQANTVTNTSTTIGFNVPGNVITVTNQLPPIAPSNGLTITLAGNGNCSTTTQPGTPNLTIKGSGVGVGLTLSGSTIVTGVAVVGFTSYGVAVTGANNKLRCSWIGVSSTVTGTNGGGVRLGITGGAAAITTTLANNLISGNSGVGLQVENGYNNSLTYNWVGLASDGTTLLRNTGGALRVLPGGQIKAGPGNRFRN